MEKHYYKEPHLLLDHFTAVRDGVYAPTDGRPYSSSALAFVHADRALADLIDRVRLTVVDHLNLLPDSSTPSKHHSREAIEKIITDCWRLIVGLTKARTVDSRIHSLFSCISDSRGVEYFSTLSYLLNEFEQILLIVIQDNMNVMETMDSNSDDSFDYEDMEMYIDGLPDGISYDYDYNGTIAALGGGGPTKIGKILFNGRIVTINYTPLDLENASFSLSGKHYFLAMSALLTDAQVVELKKLPKEERHKKISYGKRIIPELL